MVSNMVERFSLLQKYGRYANTSKLSKQQISLVCPSYTTHDKDRITNHKTFHVILWFSNWQLVPRCSSMTKLYLFSAIQYSNQFYGGRLNHLIDTFVLL